MRGGDAAHRLGEDGAVHLRHLPVELIQRHLLLLHPRLLTRPIEQCAPLVLLLPDRPLQRVDLGLKPGGLRLHALPRVRELGLELLESLFGLLRILGREY